MSPLRIFPCLLLLPLAGCRGGGEAAVATIPPPAPAETPGPATARIMTAAERVEAGDPKILSRVSFFPASKKALSDLCRPAIPEVAAGLAAGATLAYTAPSPDRQNGGRRGLRAIGRTLVWRIEDAAKARLTLPEGATPAPNAAAIRDFVLASQLGFFLLGGDATDATLGLTMVDEARLAFLPLVPFLSRYELISVSRSLRKAFDDRPSMDRTIARERDAALAAVAWMQEHAEDSLALRGEMGEDGRDLATYLKNEPRKRATFFRSLADEVIRESEVQAKLAKMPAVKRPEDPMPDLDKGRPWRKAARHLGRGIRPVLRMNDVTLARTRMLLLSLEIRRAIREGAGGPASLAKFSEAARRDPFSGSSLLYRTDGTTFLVWSVGANGVDDGGETDADGRIPDLVLDRVD